MSDPTSKTSEYETLLRNLARDIAPMVDAAAKAAVADAAPIAAVVADPVIDWIDAYVLSLLGTPPAPEVTVQPLTLETVAKHVAALQVATGHGTTAAMVTTKNTVVTPPKVVSEPVAEVA
jgi:hypothetical protein